MQCGIVAYGAYVPKLRIKAEEIARVWGKDPKRIVEGLGIQEKAVGSIDEDSATISVEAAKKAVNDFGIDAQKIGAIFVGSESKPYAVKPTATIVSEAIGAGPHLTAADFEFACKAGTAAVQVCAGMVESGMIEYGVAVGADCAQGSPNDALEFSAASGGAAMILGKHGIIARLEDTYSFTTDTPDFWRRQHEEYPQAAGRFTGEPAYFRHVVNASKGLLKKMNRKPTDYTYAVFHQPNGKFPVRAAKILGFTNEQIKQGLLSPVIGNTYSGASMVGLTAVLDVAQPGDKIFLCSYGSGSGSDAMSFEVTDEIAKKRAKLPLRTMIQDKLYIDYALYIKHRRKLKGS